MTAQVVCFGELLARLSASGSLRLEQAESLELSFGGAEANVAVSLARLGVPVRYVTRVPDNDLGRAATSALRRWGVLIDAIAVGGSRIGLYFLETGQAQRPSRVLYDRAGSAMAELEAGMIDWSATLAGSAWPHSSGITPAISRRAAEATLEAVRAARSLGLTVSIDLNDRAAQWRWGVTPERVMSELIGCADVLVGNEEDADKVLGVRPSKGDVTSGELAAADYEAVCGDRNSTLLAPNGAWKSTPVVGVSTRMMPATSRPMTSIAAPTSRVWTEATKPYGVSLASASAWSISAGVNEDTTGPNI